MKANNVAGLPAMRRVELNRSLAWFKQGFGQVVQFPMLWVLVMLGLIVLVWLLLMLPLGWLAAPLGTLIGTVLIGEMMRHCRAQEQGLPQAPRRFGSGALWTLGALGAGLSALEHLVSLALDASIGTSAWTMGGNFIGLIGLLMLVQLALSALLVMALWLAPALVALDGMAPLKAIEWSFRASIGNLAVFIVFSIATLLLTFFAVLTLGLGLLLLVPVLICASFFAHKDLFSH